MVQGATWSSGRLAASGYEVDTTCKKCGAAVCDDLHWLWTCPRHQMSESLAIRRSQKLVAEAAKEASTFPCFWLRGLVPRSWTTGAVADAGDDGQVQCLRAGVFLDRSPLPAGVWFATDGSGGEDSSDPRMRRVSFAVVALDSAWHILGFIIGGVPGEQTVNRAELLAQVILLEENNCTQCAVCFTDSGFILSAAYASDPDGTCQQKHLNL